MSHFHNPVRVRFGSDALDGIGPLVGSRRCVVLTSAGMARRGELATLQESIGRAVVATSADVTPNPTVAEAMAAYGSLAGARAEVIVALGGGSVIDTAKAVAAQCANGGDGWLAAHLREGAPYATRTPTPSIIAVPTTAGTGSEVTPWGTIWDDESGAKHSISHPTLFPEHALLDPRLTLSVPRPTTVSSALDALSHAMEAIWNRSANPVSDALALRAIQVIPTALRQVCERPDDLEARSRMFAASLVAGLAMSNTRTALAHSISYPLTAKLGLAHGIACSITLPVILVELARHAPGRADLIATALGCADADAAAEALYAVFGEVGVPAMVAARIPTVQELQVVEDELIAPGRADNFLVPADRAMATGLLRAACERLLA